MTFLLCFLLALFVVGIFCAFPESALLVTFLVILTAFFQEMATAIQGGS